MRPTIVYVTLAPRPSAPLPLQLPEAHQGGRMQSTAFGECFVLVQSAPHVPGEHYIANQIRQLREGPS